MLKLLLCLLFAGAAFPAAAGITASFGDTVIAIEALRDDVVRIRIGREGALPADESWSALPEARQARAETVPDGDLAFHTKTLAVKIDPESGAITIGDTAGKVLLANEAKASWRTAGAGYRLDFKLGPDTHFFGLGDKMGPLDRRGRMFSNWNTDAYGFQESSDALYKSVPFFIAYDRGSSFGVFLDSTWRSVFDFGADRLDRLSFGADGGGIDYYVFAGPDAKAVLSSYAWLTGAPPLPPLWAFGFQQSRFGYGSESEIRAIADRLRKDRIPSDAIWFDIESLDGYKAFTVNHERFPNFPGLIADFDRKGFKSVVIADLHLARQPGYAPYDSGLAGDHFVKLEDGSLYVGDVWPGPSVFPDFTRQRTRDWWGSLHRELYVADKVAGIWNDMNEPAIFHTANKTMPPEARHRIEEPGFAPRIATHAEIHNVFGMENTRATHDGLLALKPDQRPFVMTRASFAGGQRYAVTWTGDSTASWNHLRQSTPELLSLGLSGFAFAGVDLGGYAATPGPELLTRWIEIGMFNPLARLHCSSDSAPQEVWVHGALQEGLRRTAIENRYHLLPYIYTLAEETTRSGIPMMRPLFLEFPQEFNGAPLDMIEQGEFLWGRSLLVAPPPYGESPAPYKVVLPPGDWFDFWTGKKIEGTKPAHLEGASGTQATIALPPEQLPHLLEVTPRLSTLPVYVRAGSIIPTQTPVQHTAERPSGPLTLEVYPGPDCQGDVYLDDGTSFAYRSGAYFRQHFTCTAKPGGGLQVEITPAEGTFKPWWPSLQIRVHGEGKMREASLSLAESLHGQTLLLHPH